MISHFWEWNLPRPRSWAQMWTGYILWSKSQTSRSQRDHLQSNKHFARHFLTYLLTSRT